MILIKNNLKLMLRCKPIILILVFMVMVTGMLSAVFSDLMTDNLAIDGFTLGYSFSEGCVYEPMQPVLETVGKENGIEMISLIDGSAENAVQSGKADVFAAFSDDGCTVYSSDDHRIEASVVEMIISSLLSGTSGVQIQDYLTEYKMDVQPMPDSQMYYTIAYTVYFVWCSMIVLGVVTSSENKNKIGTRFRTSPASSLSVYLSRFVPSGIVITTLIFLGAAVCTFLFDLSWSQTALCALILLLGCIAAAALATVLFSLIRNVILCVVFGYCLIMYWGFFGGSFCPYMWATWADGIRDFSPVYYMTRSLVECNTSGSSPYTLPAVLFLCGITMVCIPLGMAAVKIGKES